MGVNVNITVNPPLEELRRRFGNVAVQDFLATQVKELSFLIEREAKKVTPVDTGRLRASIGITNFNPLTALVQPNTNYAVFVHEGTRYMRGRPFMLWGVEHASNGFEQRMRQNLDTFLNKQLNR